jgi:glycosyltransferase involved in cell wall biosynthesis
MTDPLVLTEPEAIVETSALRSRPRRRLLLVSYTFPPVGGAGVQRVAKFVKYLPQFGWDVTVLTTANPSVPVHDESLEAEIPPATIVLRTRTLEPGYKLKSTVAGAGLSPRRTWLAAGKQAALGAVKGIANGLLQPDPQILWMPHALWHGRKELRRQRYDAVMASGPPFSSFLLAAALARFGRLPLLLDYRDEWGISNQYWENRQSGWLSGWVQAGMQRRVLRRASAVIATTRASARHLRELCLNYGSPAEIQCVLNGFDPADFAARHVPADERPTQGGFHLSYVGTLWKLTTCRPLAEALRRVAAEVPLRDRFRLSVIGRSTPAEQGTLEGLKQLGLQVEEHGYMDHHQALAHMQSASELCVILADLPGAERVLPAKVFEYMAARRPILAIAPRGELWDVLRHYPAATLIEPSNVAALASHLQARIEGKAPPAAAPPPDSQFSRVRQAEQLAHVLEAMAAARSSTRN